MKINVNGVSKVRRGTKCKFCGRPILSGESFFSTDGGCLGGVIYGHTACAIKHDYSHKNEDIAHLRTASGFQWGAEFESNQRTTREERLKLKAFFDLICTDDCTVEEEFKMPIMQGLHGGKTYLDGIAKILDIWSGDNCGTHINFSLGKWYGDYAFDAFIQQNKNEIFGGLARYIMSINHFDRERVFGRGFGGWSEYTASGFYHGDWLNVDNKFRIELRIAKYQNTTQYFHLLCLCKEWALIIDKAYRENKTNGVSNLLIKALKRHIDGKAKYQSKERNK